MKEIKPKYFFVENVASMRKEDADILSWFLGVEPIKIDIEWEELTRKYGE